MNNLYDIKRLINAIDENTPLHIIEMVRGEILDIVNSSLHSHNRSTYE